MYVTGPIYTELHLQKCFQNKKRAACFWGRLCNVYFPTEVELYLYHLSCANIVWLVYDRWHRYVLKNANCTPNIAQYTLRKINNNWVENTILEGFIGGINNDSPEA